MGLNRTDWRRFAKLRDEVGTADREDRWSLTTCFNDVAGRCWQYAAKHVGPYEGGISEPFVFSNFNDLVAFVANVPEDAKAKLKAMESQRRMDPCGCHPYKGVATDDAVTFQPRVTKGTKMRDEKGPPQPKPAKALPNQTPPMGVGDLDTVLEILQQQDSVRNADLRARGLDGPRARDVLLAGVRAGKLEKHGSRGGTHYKLAA